MTVDEKTKKSLSLIENLEKLCKSRNLIPASEIPKDLVEKTVEACEKSLEELASNRFLEAMEKFNSRKYSSLRDYANTRNILGRIIDRMRFYFY